MNANFQEWLNKYTKMAVKAAMTELLKPVLKLQDMAKNKQDPTRG